MRQLKFFISALLIIMIQGTVFGQSELFNIDKPDKLPKSFYYDISDKYSETIEVKIWGAVKQPGTYKTNVGINLTELLTYAGGLTEEANLEDIRIIRSPENGATGGKQEILVKQYEQYFSGEELPTESAVLPVVLNQDIVIIPKYTSWIDSIRPFTTILSVISSLVTIIYLATRIN